MNEQQGQMLLVNQTELASVLLSSSSASSSSSSSSSPVRTRTVINVIYLLGIIFMILVFLLLLWVNLCSRRCWCWHDTPLIHRFNRQWLLQRSMPTTNDGDMSANKHHRSARHVSNADELPLWKTSLHPQRPIHWYRPRRWTSSLSLRAVCCHFSLSGVVIVVVVVVLQSRHNRWSNAGRTFDERLEKLIRSIGVVSSLDPWLSWDPSIYFAAWWILSFSIGSRWLLSSLLPSFSGMIGRWFTDASMDSSSANSKQEMCMENFEEIRRQCRMNYWRVSQIE